MFIARGRSFAIRGPAVAFSCPDSAKGGHEKKDQTAGHQDLKEAHLQGFVEREEQDSGASNTKEQRNRVSVPIGLGGKICQRAAQAEVEQGGCSGRVSQKPETYSGKKTQAGSDKSGSTATEGGPGSDKCSG